MSRGGTPLYKPYTCRYVPPRTKYIFLSRLCLKTGLHFSHFGLESGIVFDGITGMYERICYFSSEMNTLGRVVYEFEVDRVTIWRARRHTPQGAHTTCVRNHNFKISNLYGSKISLFLYTKSPHREVHWV